MKRYLAKKGTDFNEKRVAIVNPTTRTDANAQKRITSDNTFEITERTHLRPLVIEQTNSNIGSRSITNSVNEGAGVNVGVGVDGGKLQETTATVKQDKYGNPLPLIPTMAVRLFKKRLTKHERTEISNYQEIWYLGLGANKVNGYIHLPNNFGFDDQDGCYLKIPDDHIAYRYQIINVLGTGTFGEVIKAFDHRTNDEVAIKIIRNRPEYIREGQTEVTILNALHKKDTYNRCNIVRMVDYFHFRNHFCIVFELLGSDLYHILELNDFNGFEIDQIRKIAISVLRCLKLMHRERVIHCDLKPENILVGRWDPNSFKVIDFGCSCYEKRRPYNYIQTRFYRAPEVILGIPYSTQIDMWSLGCILAELYTGSPLFPGENEKEQLAYMMEVFSIPPEHIRIKGTRASTFFDCRGKPRFLASKKGKRWKVGTKRLPQIIKTKEHRFLNFIQLCLQWDPIMRLTPYSAIKHDWITKGSTTFLPLQKEKVQAKFSSKPKDTKKEKLPMGKKFLPPIKQTYSYLKY